MRADYGKILQTELKKEGMPTVTDFANMLGMSVKTLYNVFNGSSELTFSQIVLASKFLNKDFIKIFAKMEGSVFAEPEGEYTAKKNTFSLTLNLRGTMTDVINIPDMISHIKDIATQQGFKLV